MVSLILVFTCPNGQSDFLNTNKSFLLARYGKLFLKVMLVPDMFCAICFSIYFFIALFNKWSKQTGIVEAVVKLGEHDKDQEYKLRSDDFHSLKGSNHVTGQVLYAFISKLVHISDVGLTQHC